jgi:hypothetical protein
MAWLSCTVASRGKHLDRVVLESFCAHTAAEAEVEQEGQGRFLDFFCFDILHLLRETLKGHLRSETLKGVTALNKGEA